MAPEQATGDPSTDHRADLYAFGCLAYEVFAGAPPFHGGPVHKVIAAHLKETPRPLAESRADVPEPIAALVHRCLEKDPAHRPQGAGEILVSLEGAVHAISQPVPRPRAPGSTQRRGAIIGVAVVALAVAIGALTRVGRPAIGEPVTLALAPFDVSRDTALESRSDGIRDEILTGMAKVSGVRIVGRLAGARYKPRIGLTPDVRAIARDLGARLLVTGTMRASGGRVTLSVQLNDSATTGEVWSDEFVRDSADLPSLTDTVVRSLADTLRARFGSRIGGARIAGVRGPRVANDAFVEWALGREALNRRGAQVAAGSAHFERAIALDPRFAQAHASLATALQLRPYFMGTPPATIRDSTLQEATLALQLDSTLSDAHAALGAMYAHAGQWDSATVEFRHALALQPENATARLTYARILIVRGQTTEGLAELRDAARTERDWPVIGAWLSYALFLTGQVDSAIAESDRAVTREPGLLPATNLGSLMNLALGRTQKAHDLVAVMPPVSVMTYAAYVYAKLGDTVTANALVHAMESSHPRPWFTDIARATVRLAVGDSAAALAALEAGARASGPTWYMYAPVADPMWDLVRNSPRFIALLRFAEIDPAHIERSWRSGAR
jgi:serine/threonine-protein kinase